MSEDNDYQIVMKACSQLAAWHKEGRSLPRYKSQFGRPFLSYLKGTAYDGNAYEAWFADLVGIATQIAGPHGWAITQAYMIKARERFIRDTDNRKRRKQRRKLWREIRREKRR